VSSRIIEMLEEGQGQYVSGELLSKELGISRTAIWKQIKKLEAIGYRFEASRKLGYRIVSKPSKLQLNELVEKMKGLSFVKGIKLYETVESTQNIAQQLAENDAPEGTLVLAEQQTSGRGRRGRQWLSPYGSSVSMSLILRPSLPLQFAPQMTLVAAVALCRGLRELTGLDIGIKWPNDLLINGKKISGILMESTAEDERVRYIIAGIGIGVNLQESDYSDELRRVATSLSLEMGQQLNRSDVIAAFITHFAELYTLYLSEGFSPIISLWEALSVTLHKQTVLTTAEGIVEGTPIGLCDSGALSVRKTDGTIIAVFSADSIIPVQE